MGFTIIAETAEVMKQLIQRALRITLITTATELVIHLTGDKNG
jgi:hypothetical protein